MYFQPLAASELSTRQREIAASIAARRRGGMDSPFEAMLRAPEVADRLQLLDEHLRFGLLLPERLRAVAILVTAAHHGPDDAAHFSGIGQIRESGLGGAKLDALAARIRPEELDKDEALVHQFATELAEIGRVSTPVFDAAASRFGRDIVIELIAVCGHTAMLVVMLNVTQTRFSAG